MTKKIKERKLSKHVQSRWYRAPEVIVNNPDYDQKIDIWSIGCVLSDIINQLDETEDKYESRTIFPGSSCYPLSPFPKGDDDKVTIDKDDQLFKILEHKPHSEKDFGFIKDNLAKQYVM